MKFNEIADSLIENIGGIENIAGLTHCATRLRFTLKDENKADETKVKNITGVLGVARNGGQFQVIIGNEVPKAYAAIIEKYDIGKDNHPNQDTKKKGLEVVFDFVSSIFTPVLPAIIGAGLIKSVLALAVLLGMDDQSTTYYFINLIGDAPLYFLPMMLAVTASKKLGCNQFLALAISGAMLHPSYAALISDAFSLHFSSMFGIPVTLASYQSSVIPVILMVIALKYVNKVLDAVIPTIVKFFFKPLFTLLIVATLTFTILGPIGFVCGIAISTGLNTLSTYAGWLVPMIIGAIFPLMVTTGMHYGIVPFMLQSNSAQGFEQICGPGNLPSNIAQGAASLAVAMKTKQAELKQVAFTSGVTALLGVTEPALFSVTLKYKKVLTCVMAGGACGGLYAGIMGVKCFSFCTPGLLSLVAYIGPDGWGNIIHSCIAMGIGFVVTFLMVWMWGFKDVDQDMQTKKTQIENSREHLLGNPVVGDILLLSEVHDPTFAQEMLGKGFAVKPKQDNVYSPVDGIIATLFPTKHAIGIVADTGEEILIHVGLDTVNLNGMYFEALVKQGDRVKQGDCILKCDFKNIEKAGFDTTIPVIITNTKEYQNIEVIHTGYAAALTHVLLLK